MIIMRRRETVHGKRQDTLQIRFATYRERGWGERIRLFSQGVIIPKTEEFLETLIFLIVKG